MNKVHYIHEPPNYMAFDRTACGLAGQYEPDTAGEYSTVAGDRFEARLQDWRGVTCKRCLRARAALEQGAQDNG